jgi:hypothetical protein
MSRRDVAGPRDTTAPETDAGVQLRAQVAHKFPDYDLKAGEEVVPCVQWTLNNDKPVYVDEVTLANEGGFHHSNWFVVPEDYAAGEDGYFNCDDRGFREVTAAVQGTVLFAQSTQAKSEDQDLPDGAAIKVPPNHKIVADVHFLNTTPRRRSIGARMTLDIVHPRLVDTVVTPFRVSYYDLQIAPHAESRFTTECNMADSYREFTGGDFDVDLFYILPHYHGLGNYFGVEFFGGPRDGEQIFELKGFNAEENGRTYDPPISLNDSKGLRVTCGYNNPTGNVVQWGLGGAEMCVMLAFADMDALVDAAVRDGNERVGTRNGIIRNEGPCQVTTLPKSPRMDSPTETEKKRPLYVPASDDEQLDPVPDCEDRDGTAAPFRTPTLTNLDNQVFSVSCAYTSCHDDKAPTFDLDLESKELHDALMNHEVRSDVDMPLVDPGEPDNSWLYRITSNCKPKTRSGTTAHMPRNSPTLLDPRLTAMIREWIERGAKDN